MDDIEAFDDEENEVAIPEIAPTASQSKAIAAIKDWYQGYPENGQQVFRLFGYAGTGKTTLTKYAIADLGLSMFQPPKRNVIEKGPIPNVYFGSFTGKASYVMRKHGTPAQTIHSMIYSVMEASEEQVIEAEIRLRGLIEAISGKSGMEKTMAIATAEAFRSELTKMKKPVYSLDPDADVSASKLIVLDEVSMVNEEMAGHVLSYGKPVLVIGDPGQLPPVKGEGAFVAQTPDIMLDEIHRQALDSPIIRLATMARQGQAIPKGVYGDTVHKMRKEDISGTQLLRADQVICGLNATRYQLNSAMRAIAGFRQFGDLPSGMKLPDVRGNLASSC
jgi:exodeoxyribonuclease-5